MGVILSAWGIIQLSLMGIFFYIQSVALVEDIPLRRSTLSCPLINDMEAGYHQNAQNCWIAALLYLVTLCVSVQQFWMNNRTTYSVWELYSNIPQVEDIKMTETQNIKIIPVYLVKLYTSFKNHQFFVILWKVAWWIKWYLFSFNRAKAFHAGVYPIGVDSMLEQSHKKGNLCERGIDPIVTLESNLKDNFIMESFNLLNLMPTISLLDKLFATTNTFTFDKIYSNPNEGTEINDEK